MKTFEVVLTKSYTVKIQAKNRESAKEFSLFYTGDIKDISTSEERKFHNFEIEEIDAKINEVFEIQEINENN